MARFERLEVYKIIFSDGMIPLFYNKDKEVARAVTEALYKGGSRIVEFTNRGEGALEVFSFLINIAPKIFPKMIIGAGTITDAPTAALFIANGADFIVGPNFDEEIAKLCNKKRIPYIPGAATISEIIKAEEFGAELIKIFPGRIMKAAIIAAIKPRTISNLTFFIQFSFLLIKSQLTFFNEIYRKTFI